VWDRERQEVLLARDRFGVRPLFLAEYDGDVCFASEAKALLRHPSARRELDPVGIVDSFTARATLPDRSAFVGIRELPPAHYVVVGRDGIGPTKRWWDLEFSPVEAPEDDLIDELEAILVDSTRIRLRADVEVAAYLSGGLDSSVTAAIAAGEVERLHAFGVGFSDSRFDESGARDPDSSLRPLLFRRLNRWLATDPARAGAFLGQFYGRDLLATDDPLYSHRVRFANTARCLRLLRPDFAAGAAGSDPAERLVR